MRAVLAVCLLAACGKSADERAAEKKAAVAFDRFRRPDLLVAALALQPGQAVADIGAGRGYLTHRLAAAVGEHGHVVATDIDFAELQKIGNAKSGEAAIETRKVPADDPSLENGAYDLVLLSEVDHLLENRAAYLAKLMLALKPAGRIAVVNRRLYRVPLLAAAERAGLRVAAERSELPAHFLILLERKK